MEKYQTIWNGSQQVLGTSSKTDTQPGMDVTAGTDEDMEVQLMRQRIKDMEAEAAKLQEMQKQVEEALGTPSPSASGENKDDIDARSIYVGNVDYATTPEDLQSHFKECGTVNRVTILCDKFTQQPKGFAYVEFATTDAVANALPLDSSVLHGRAIKVSAKRTNVPGYSTTNRGSRGRGGRKVGAINVGGVMYIPMYRGGRGAPRFRARRGSYFQPY